jgi:hypothetical protein
MTPSDRTLLDDSIDKVVVLELANGDRLLVQILVVVDEDPTPDLFCTEVDPITHDPVPTATHSILLSDIARVTLVSPPSSPSSVPN